MWDARRISTRSQPADARPAELAGLALSAAGIAALFPTLMSVLTSTAPDERRGTATSVVTTVAYLGFLADPVYVGTWAGAALRGISPPARSRSSG